MGSFCLSHWLSSGHILDFLTLGFPHSPLCSIVRFLPFCLAWQRATRKLQNVKYVMLLLPQTECLVEFTTLLQSFNATKHFCDCFLTLLIFTVEFSHCPRDFIFKMLPVLFAWHLALLNRHTLLYVLPSLPHTGLSFLLQVLLQTLRRSFDFSLFPSATNTVTIGKIV